VNQQPLKLLGGRTQMVPDDFEVLGRLYDGEVAYTDHCIGELLDGLRESGALEHAIVAVTSGHGENLGDHGLMDHMFSVHDSIVRVPLIIRYPRGQHRGLEPGLVQTHDLLPTLIALADGDRPRRNGHAPRARTPRQGWMLPPFGPPRSFAVSEVMQMRPPAESTMRRYPGFDARVYGRALRGLRTATHKYIRDSNGVEELYCLVADPGETIDRARSEPEQTSQLRGVLDGWEAGFTPIVGGDGAERAPDPRRQELV
jgi:arylsulfatase A-like enzyme